MNVLLDEMMPAKLRQQIVGHTVKTIAQAGWKGTVNGALLRLAEEQFDAFMTMDTALPSGQKLAEFDLGFVIIHAVNNKLETLVPLVPQMLQALNHLQPRQVVHVPEDQQPAGRRRRS